jgi:hypothetical protein
MHDKLVFRILFWFAAIAPLFAIELIGVAYGDSYLMILLLMYALTYRPIVHVLRLLQLGAIEEKDAWKFFVPLYQLKYTRQLWLG